MIDRRPALAVLLDSHTRHGEQGIGDRPWVPITSGESVCLVDGRRGTGGYGDSFPVARVRRHTER